MPASLNQGELENHSIRMSYVATRGNVFGPNQFPGFGSHRIKAAYELVVVSLKVCGHLSHGQSSTQLVSYNAAVVVVLAANAGVCLQWLPWVVLGEWLLWLAMMGQLLCASITIGTSIGNTCSYLLRLFGLCRWFVLTALYFIPV